MSNVSELWPEEALEAIHLASLLLLERVGVRVDGAEAREALLAAGCTPGPLGRLLMPKGLVDTALGSCPPRFTIAGRGAASSLPVDSEPGPSFVHNMGGARDIVDPQTGDRRRATLRDQSQLARVMHHLTNQHALTPLVQPADVPDLLEPLYSYLVLALESDKCIAGPAISTLFQARYLTEMAVAVTGADGSDDRYPLCLAFSPVSPLILGEDVTDALMTTARSGRVVCEVLPAPALGTTGPAALSACLAQQNAEALASLVTMQTVAPGTPAYYGPRLSSSDPRTGRVVSGTPETGVASMAAVLLARRYGLACDCYGPTTDSTVADAQLGWEHAFNAYLGLRAQPRFLSGIGDVAAGVASSVEVLVLDDEILNDAFYGLRQPPFDTDALDIDAMCAGVLSDAGFLGSKHTRRYIHSDLCAPMIRFRVGLAEWAASGRRSVVDAARERAEAMLARKPVGLPDDVAEELCRLIDTAAKEIGLTEWLDPRAVIELVQA